MTSDNVRISAIQMVSTADYYENIGSAKRLIIEAAQAGSNILVLPEYFCFMGMQEQDKYEYVEKHKNGELQSMLSGLAEKYGVWIIAGTHPIASNEPARPYGRCYVYDDHGKVATWYDKIHLFDVNVPDSKGSYRESAMTKAGDKVICFNTPWGMIGIAVCYDLRFPELFRQQAKAGCEIIILPAAFTYKTGEKHWQVLIQARAIENLCYFVASAQGGTHQNGRETWGHSCIVSPWGDILAELPDGEGFVHAELDRNALTELRTSFPVLKHRKLLT
ncbi:MAG: carbon-nitrogen hydrolase family protein, partial [Kangiellaceae bacterium]|nr:carbon-nitrogen hydrolase family protein [Kangiellaceae bacterium]